MRKFFLGLGAAAVCAFISVSASAAPMTPLSTDIAPAVESNVIKVHGWHRYCDTGMFGRHRHVPGVGRVPCGGDGGPGYGHCRRWRSECADRWGWRGWEFRRCLRRHGC